MSETFEYVVGGALLAVFGWAVGKLWQRWRS